MASAAAVEWLLGECGSSPHARDPPAAKQARDDGSWSCDLPFDLAVVICMDLWTRDAKAPRLAAVNSTFMHASTQAAINMRGVDVMPARQEVTEPDGQSIDPEDGANIVTFTEHLASWGVRLEHYTPFNIIAPHATKDVELHAGATRRGILRSIDKAKMATLLG